MLQLLSHLGELPFDSVALVTIAGQAHRGHVMNLTERAVMGNLASAMCHRDGACTDSAAPDVVAAMEGCAGVSAHLGDGL